ncbi:glycosyltransferase family 32 protein [Streptococcus equinus]|uniref:glycosyltransferase family 32 protein n=1 Tax=Streptococcus equinus TaxID=1335 RepID=UPI0037D70548
MIEKKIHYCWFGGNPIPDNLKKCISSWKKTMPDYEFIKWDESNFDLDICQYVKEAYESKKWAFVTDYVRLYVVFHYGGIYLDTDVETIRSFDSLLKLPAFMGFEDSNKKNKEVNTGLGFGSVKGNPIIKEMLDDYENRAFIKDSGELDTTPCPQIQTRLLVKHGLKLDNTLQYLDDIVIFPTDYFCPMNQVNGKMSLTDNTFSIHHYFDSWNSESDRYRRELRMKYAHFGFFLSNILSTFVAYRKYYGLLGMVRELINKVNEKK